MCSRYCKASSRCGLRAAHVIASNARPKTPPSLAGCHGYAPRNPLETHKYRRSTPLMPQLETVVDLCTRRAGRPRAQGNQDTSPSRSSLRPSTRPLLRLWILLFPLFYWPPVSSPLLTKTVVYLSLPLATALYTNPPSLGLARQSIKQ